MFEDDSFSWDSDLDDGEHYIINNVRHRIDEDGGHWTVEPIHRGVPYVDDELTVQPDWGMELTGSQDERHQQWGDFIDDVLTNTTQSKYILKDGPNGD